MIIRTRITSFHRYLVGCCFHISGFVTSRENFSFKIACGKIIQAVVRTNTKPTQSKPQISCVSNQREVGEGITLRGVNAN
eukprot:4151479-Pyramimonas_sp.AAC.1